MPPIEMLVCDLCMDTAVLITAQLCFGRLSLRRIFLSLGCLQLSGIAYFCFGAYARRPAATAGFCIAAAFLLIKPKRIGELISCALCIFLIPTLSAGMMTLCGKGFSFAALPAIICFLILFRRRMHIHYRWNIDVSLEDNGHKLSFRALIDTGNRLKEPLSGLPVLIVAADVFPCDFLEGRQLRYLNYGVLGSTGKLPAFHAESVYIYQNGTGPNEVPDCYIAVFNGKIPGGLQALAPPEFAEVLEPVSIKRRIFVRRKKECRFQA